MYRKCLKMADETEILESWEELENNEVLDKKLKGIKISNGNDRSNEKVSELREEGGRTQYAPQVRILKRDTSATMSPEDRAKNLKGPQKSIQQREAEYKEARLRILGEGYSGAGDNSNTPVTAQPDVRPIKLIKPTDEMNQPRVMVVREPRGPNGTAGFDQHR
ncbi:SUZ domain-containing protein 1-like [Mya arenaria]|uniref:SUZ domain-containing protein 1-like n=1 Tax=Mya arenaria TaxID=6604 RepID=UPI0022E2FB7C|nr:SUZ domain-containing protein 1-like [Mya arenaria]